MFGCRYIVGDCSLSLVGAGVHLFKTLLFGSYLRVRLIVCPVCQFVRILVSCPLENWFGRILLNDGSTYFLSKILGYLHG